MAEPISRRLLAHLVADRLQDLGGETSVYVGEIRNADGTTKPPVRATDGVLDPDGRVAPYVVIWPGDGRPFTEQPLLEQPGTSLDWQFNLTMASGFPDDTLELVTNVHGLLDLWRPTLEDHRFGRLRPPAGYSAGAVRRDRDVQPHRFYLPGQFVLPVHR